MIISYDIIVTVIKALRVAHSVLLHRYWKLETSKLSIIAVFCARSYFDVNFVNSEGTKAAGTRVTIWRIDGIMVIAN